MFHRRVRALPGSRKSAESRVDGIEIHSGLGYLLSQFLSPAYNKRQDEYGGSIENRVRIHLKIYQAIRDVVGPDYPVLIKINCADFIENGLTIDDSLQAAGLFADAGFDAIETSGGIIRTGKLSPSRPGITTEDREAYFKEYAGRFKKNIKIPDLINRWKKGDRRKAECKPDNLCFNPGFGGKGVYCVTRENEKNKRPHPQTSQFS